jgi:hypothetical protein
MLKSVIFEWKDKTQMHLSVNCTLLHNNMHKGFSKLLRPCYDT